LKRKAHWYWDAKEIGVIGRKTRREAQQHAAAHRRAGHRQHRRR
jgi:hypothetical protein